MRLVAVTEAEAGRIARERDGAIAACSARAFARAENRARSRGRPDRLRGRRISACAAPHRTQSWWNSVQNVLDIGLRMRVHELESGIAEQCVSGVLETTAGIRSLLIRFDPRRRAAPELARESSSPCSSGRAPSSRESCPAPCTFPCPGTTRPAGWQSTDTCKACAPMRPGCPDNIEFIRRINGLRDRQAVKDIVFSADYLVMGLGDVLPRCPGRHARGSAAPAGDHQVQPGAYLGRRRTRSALVAPTCASTGWKVPEATSSWAERCRSGTSIGVGRLVRRAMAAAALRPDSLS